MVYVSRYKEHRLVISPATQVMMGPNKLVTVPGKAVQFKNGLYDTVDPDAIRTIEGSKDYGIHIWNHEEQTLAQAEAVLKSAQGMVAAAQARKDAAKNDLATSRQAEPVKAPQTRRGKAAEAAAQQHGLG